MASSPICTRSAPGSFAPGAVSWEYGCIAKPSARSGRKPRHSGLVRGLSLRSTQASSRVKRSGPMLRARPAARGPERGQAADQHPVALRHRLDLVVGGVVQPPVEVRRRGLPAIARAHPLGPQEDAVVGLVPGGPQPHPAVVVARHRACVQAVLAHGRAPDVPPVAPRPLDGPAGGEEAQVDHHLHAARACAVDGGVQALQRRAVVGARVGGVEGRLAARVAVGRQLAPAGGDAHPVDPQIRHPPQRAPHLGRAAVEQRRVVLDHRLHPLGGGRGAREGDAGGQRQRAREGIHHRRLLAQ